MSKLPVYVTVLTLSSDIASTAYGMMSLVNNYTCRLIQITVDDSHDYNPSPDIIRIIQWSHVIICTNASDDQIPRLTKLRDECNKYGTKYAEYRNSDYGDMEDKVKSVLMSDDTTKIIEVTPDFLNFLAEFDGQGKVDIEYTNEIISCYGYRLIGSDEDGLKFIKNDISEA